MKTGMFCFILCFGVTGTNPAATDFCAVLDKTIQGELRFTRKELEMLQRVNREDLAALKLTRKKLCPTQ